jgi:hypothetical protein
MQRLLGAEAYYYRELGLDLGDTLDRSLQWSYQISLSTTLKPQIGYDYLILAKISGAHIVYHIFCTTCPQLKT